MVNGPLGYALEIGSNSFTVHLQDVHRSNGLMILMHYSSIYTQKSISLSYLTTEHVSLCTIGPFGTMYSSVCDKPRVIFALTSEQTMLYYYRM